MKSVSSFHNFVNLKNICIIVRFAGITFRRFTIFWTILYQYIFKAFIHYINQKAVKNKLYHVTKYRLKINPWIFLLVRTIFNLRFRSNRYFSFLFVDLRRIKEKGLHDWVAIDFIANYDLTHKFIPYTLHVIYSQRDYEL